MNYVISKEALNDLEKIWFYTFDHWSPEQADRYYNLLIVEIERLAKDPFSGEDCSEIRQDYFRSRVNSHFIFYKILLKKKEIAIIRILHQQMDIESRLLD